MALCEGLLELSNGMSWMDAREGRWQHCPRRRGCQGEGIEVRGLGDLHGSVSLPMHRFVRAHAVRDFYRSSAFLGSREQSFLPCPAPRLRARLILWRERPVKMLLSRTL
jgi:hypothetical protein